MKFSIYKYVSSSHEVTNSLTVFPHNLKYTAAGNSMKSKFDDCIRPWHIIYKMFGSWYIVDGYFYCLELTYAFLVFTVYAFCWWHQEYTLIIAKTDLFLRIQHVVFFVAVEGFYMMPFISFFRFRRMNNDLQLLVKTASRLCSINLSLSTIEYRQISWCGMSIHVYYATYLLVLLHDIMVKNAKYNAGYIDEACVGYPRYSFYARRYYSNSCSINLRSYY